MTNYFKHKTHTGEIISGVRLQDALEKVASDWAENARAIRKEDAYAPHISEHVKDYNLLQGLKFSDQIRRGEIGGFTVWQRVNQVLTGECIPLLSKWKSSDFRHSAKNPQSDQLSFW